jgi:serine/threonine protein kinase
MIPTETYFTVDFLSRSQCERLYTRYKQGKQIGKGAYSKVYEACLGADCKYVLKVMKYDYSLDQMIGGPRMSLQTWKQRWTEELRIHYNIEGCQSKFAYKFSPHLYDAWYCNEKNGDVTFYMIMEKYEGNLLDFITRFEQQPPLVRQLVNTIVDVVCDKLLGALKHIHDSCNICLNDIKIENILYKDVQSTTAKFEFVFADFGLSQHITQTSSELCKQEDMRKLRATIDDFKAQVTSYLF